MNVYAPVKAPSHVPADRIFDFDLYNRDPNPRLKGNLHQGLTYLHKEAPPVFWTPHNGGHWVVTSFKLLRQITLDAEHFSTTVQYVPRPQGEVFVAIPLNVDPPEHTAYRQIIMRYLAPKAMNRLADNIRLRAVELIDKVVARGSCDFVSEIAIPYPVSIFMELIGWPLERMAEFRALAEEYFSGPTDERRDEIIATVLQEMTVMINDRAQNPRDDLMSRMLTEEIDGKPLSQQEILSMCFFLFVAGLDTVANAAGFFMRTLGSSPQLQQMLVEDPSRLPDFIEESLRTNGVVNTIRMVKKDIDFGGVTMRKDDMVVLMLTMGGLDEELHDCPHKFDMDRRSRTNLMFGSGVHLCAGHHLARLELKIMIEEWLKRIPQFSIHPDFDNRFRLGTVMALQSLPLVWQTAN